jgi:TolB-like protein
MKKIFTSVVCVLLSVQLFAQTEFDKLVTDISQKLATKLDNSGNTRVAVASFVDLQGNVTELGKYIAEAFSVELVNTSLKVVDRSRLDDLIKELNFTKEKLTKPENALKLGKMAGIQYLITGTTTMLDKSIDVSIKAYDIEHGTISAAQRGMLPRTDAINELFRSQLSGSAAPSLVTTMPERIGSPQIDATDDANQVKSTIMKKSICKDWQGNYQGYVCFENQTQGDLVLYHIGPYTQTPNTLVAKNGKACSPLLWTNGPYADEPKAAQYIFYFRTTDTENPLYTSFTIVVEGCITKSVVLSSRNLSFKKTKY